MSSIVRNPSSMPGSPNPKEKSQLIRRREHEVKRLSGKPGTLLERSTDPHKALQNGVPSLVFRQEFDRAAPTDFSILQIHVLGVLSAALSRPIDSEPCGKSRREDLPLGLGAQLDPWL